MPFIDLLGYSVDEIRNISRRYFVNVVNESSSLYILRTIARRRVTYQDLMVIAKRMVLRYIYKKSMKRPYILWQK